MASIRAGGLSQRDSSGGTTDPPDLTVGVLYH